MIQKENKFGFMDMTLFKMGYDGDDAKVVNILKDLLRNGAIGNITINYLRANPELLAA